MAIRHNNQLANVHFHKDWQRRVKTWFNQPGRKLRRRLTREKKIAAIAPRPIDGALRPIVQCPTVKYNIKARTGKGFTIEELKVAGIPKKFARTVGIAVDHRRRNKSDESLARNVQRLKAYRARLIVFPRRSNRNKKGDSSKEELAAAKQLPVGHLNTIKSSQHKEKARCITEEEKKKNQFQYQRWQREELKLVGYREKRAKEKAEEEANKVTKK